MFGAVFFTVGGDAEVHVGIGFFCHPTNAAAVQSLRFRDCGCLEFFASALIASAFQAVSEKGGRKKQQVISEAHHNHHLHGE